MKETYSHLWAVYWTWWFILSTGFFLVPETYALVTHHPEDTLSANVWRMENFLPGQDIVHWTAMHLLFIGVLILIDIWLIGHFGFGFWR
jgi:hypothetical protein